MCLNQQLLSYTASCTAPFVLTDNAHCFTAGYQLCDSFIIQKSLFLVTDTQPGTTPQV